MTRYYKSLAIDIGGTMGSRKNGGFEVFPNCFETIKKLSGYFTDIFVISRVNSEQRERSLKWLAESDFFNQTGVNPNNLFYCFERKDKSIFARALNITHFIDDRAEVMFYLQNNINKILFRPSEKDLQEYKDRLHNTIVTDNWKDIPRLLNIGEISKSNYIYNELI